MPSPRRGVTSLMNGKRSAPTVTDVALHVIDVADEYTDRALGAAKETVLNVSNFFSDEGEQKRERRCSAWRKVARRSYSVVCEARWGRPAVVTESQQKPQTKRRSPEPEQP